VHIRYVWRRGCRAIARNDNYLLFCKMKVSIDLNNPFLIKAKKLSGIESNKLVIEKALQLFIAAGSQNKLKSL